MSLRLKQISLRLASFTLRVDIDINGGAVAIFGPSGAGKTSLLDLIAGLRRPESALIELDGQVLADTAKGISIPARARRIGYMPQDLALFPHMDVRQNLLYGHKSGGDLNGLFSFQHVTEVLEIQALIERSVLELSGGEKQRVALGRALMTAPRLLLLDEPLASLDEALKAKILPYLVRVRDEFRVPMLYVTHNRQEVMALCDEVLEMNAGQITSRSNVRDFSTSHRSFRRSCLS